MIGLTLLFGMRGEKNEAAGCLTPAGARYKKAEFAQSTST
jgi:hypothetical protein